MAQMSTASKTKWQPLISCWSTRIGSTNGCHFGWKCGTKPENHPCHKSCKRIGSHNHFPPAYFIGFLFLSIMPSGFVWKSGTSNSNGNISSSPWKWQFRVLVAPFPDKPKYHIKLVIYPMLHSCQIYIPVIVPLCRFPLSLVKHYEIMIPLTHIN